MSIEIGTKVLMKRTEKKLSQSGLAKSINMLQSRLSEIETGSKSPTWQELENISSYLEVPVYDLLPSSHTQIFKCISNDSSQQYNGNISIQVPLNSMVSMLKEIIKEEIKNNNFK